MRKQITAILLLLAMCIALLAGCGDTASATTVTFAAPTASAPRQIHPLLYKVSDQKGNVIWLFGSIHIGSEHFYPLPEYVRTAFEGSDALAVEADILAYEQDAEQQAAILDTMMYTDGTTIKDHISQETYNEAVQILKDSGVYDPSMDQYLPVMWYSMVQSCAIMKSGYDPELGIDRHLLQKAKDSGMEILEIESADFQYNMLSGFSPELQEYLLENIVLSASMPTIFKFAMKMMVSAWESGDEEDFSSYLNTEGVYISSEDARLMTEFNEAMESDRNDSMTQYAVEALESGKEIFICVGAAHVVGDGAMAQQLRQLGYTVEIVG